MSNTRCQNECETWVRENWLPEHYGHQFTETNVLLTSGGKFKFDAVSADASIVVSISTSRAAMSCGKPGVGKKMKLRGDMLFHMLAFPARHVMVFTEPCMLALVQAERSRGRVPTQIEFALAPLPDELAQRLATSRESSSREVRAAPQISVA